MKATIKPSTISGSVMAPPSKSVAHRYIICAALSAGKSIVSNIELSEDIKATLDCIRACGATAEVKETDVIIDGITKENIPEEIDFYCRESGSTMRFFMGLAMYFGKKSRFYGSDTLRKRPFGIYEEICKNQGITFDRSDEYINLEGKIKAGDYEIAGNISSQFITGLLYVLPLLEEDSRIHLIPPVESRSYIDLTLQAMEKFGVKASWEGENDLVIKGGQKYCACNVEVEGDCSNAAFLEGFNYLGGDVNVSGVAPDTIQGDRVYKELFDKLRDDYATIDISDCPDLGPVLFSIAASCHGAKFTGTKRLKIKESDRGSVMCKELSKLGVDSKMSDNEIEIIAPKDGLKAPSEIIEGHNDHRIVMSFALLLTITGGIINEANAVRKSYPSFWDDCIRLGMEVDFDGVD